MKNTAKPAAARVGVNVRIPASVHRAARIAMAASRCTWDEAVAEALDTWARARLRRLPVDEGSK